jgi:hypothetical protein
MPAWLRKLLGTSSATASRPAVGREANLGHGGFGFEVVGEQSYQNRLRKVKAAGKANEHGHVTFACQLRYEINSHTHSPAVRVDTSDGQTVGYFPQEQAKIYAAAIAKLEQGGDIAVCQGVLVGGEADKPSLGVYLDFKPKLLGLRA